MLSRPSNGPAQPVPRQTMQSTRALLNRIIDYAGLFPPASLDMAANVRNYAQYLKSGESWMLGRLIIPVSRLDEFEQEAEDLLPRNLDEEPWQLSALAAAAGTAELEGDIAAIEAFNDRHADEAAGLASIDVIEMKASGPGAIDGALDQIPAEVFAFFEVPIDSDPRGAIAALVDGDAGAKVRTGGTTADAYPTPENLARFIAACAAGNVPFKATAGLHHPWRRTSDVLKIKEFGFLNLFLAGCLALTHEMPEQDILQLLHEESPSAFDFDGDGITWRDYRIMADNIEDVREEFAISFGSCSFEEPVAQLKSMKLL
jgi:hypothetical protein